MNIKKDKNYNFSEKYKYSRTELKLFYTIVLYYNFLILYHLQP